MKYILFSLLLLITISSLASATFVQRGRGYTKPSSVIYWTDPNATFLLLRYWFDPTSTNSLGLVNDSASSFHGTLVSNPVWTIIGTDSAGRTEHAYTFNGSNSIQITTPGYTLDPWGNDWSWGCWVNVATSGNYGVMGRVSYQSPIYSGWYTYIRGLTVGSFYSASSRDYLTPQSTITTNTWVHIFTTTKHHTYIKLWTNGCFAASNSLEAQTGDCIPDTPFAVACEGDGESYSYNVHLYLNGMIDDVRVYGGTNLTSEAVSNLWWNTRKGNNSLESGY